MVGRDLNSKPTQYRTWVVDNEPDYTGELYTGYKSGPEPFVDVTAYLVLDDDVVVDFNMPDPQNWTAALATMPEAVTNSQLAILDGYIYLFGGQLSDKIFRAPVENPQLWEDTGAHLPALLSGSSLAVINDTIYLFGGQIDETVDNIYSAPVSNPLSWTDHGSLLPDKLHKSSLVIWDGYVYLFGGAKKDFAQQVIFRASVDDPLTWVDTGEVLPQKLYGAQLAMMGDHIYLLGGLLKPDTPINSIYRAAKTNPLFWSLAGQLPFAAAHGQFLALGTKGYLFTPGNVIGPQPYFTKILRCDLDDPTNWIDGYHIIPGSFSQSQFAIIYDRIFAFGGNGTSAIYSCNQILKYNLTADNVEAQTYGDTTRTQVAATDPLDMFEVLCFPWWKSDYKVNY